MPNLVWLESGGDATNDLSTFWNSAQAVGTGAVDSTISHTGPRSIKMSTMNPAVTAKIKSNATDNLGADVGRRISFWVRFDTIPTVAGAFSQLYQSDYSTAVAILRLMPTGVIRLTLTGVTAVDGTIVLAINTWYRITLSYTITNTTTFRFQTYINGIPDVNITSGTMTAIGTSVLSFEASINWGINANSWFDDLYIDAGTDYTDPGNIRVTAKRPAANNVNNFDTAIGANPSNRWTNVNERPLSETNGWEQLAIADTQENYTLEAANVGDVNITGKELVARMAWVWAKETASAGTPKIMDDGTEWSLTLDTFYSISTLKSPPGNTPTVYPSNAAGIGMRSAATAAGTFMAECGTLLAFREDIVPYHPEVQKGPILAQ